MPAQEKRVIKFPQKLGVKLGEIAKELGTTNETLLSISSALRATDCT